MERPCETGTVPVVFALDDGYAMPTAVAIYTMLKSYTRESMQIVFLFKGALKDRISRAAAFIRRIISRGIK